MWNIHLQHMQHQIYFYNTQMKHMKHTSEMQETCSCNVCSSTCCLGKWRLVGTEVASAKLISSTDLSSGRSRRMERGRGGGGESARAECATCGADERREQASRAGASGVSRSSEERRRQSGARGVRMDRLPPLSIGV
jgi:hypothetical protein